MCSSFNVGALFFLSNLFCKQTDARDVHNFSLKHEKILDCFIHVRSYVPFIRTYLHVFSTLRWRCLLTPDPRGYFLAALKRYRARYFAIRIFVRENASSASFHAKPFFTKLSICRSFNLNISIAQLRDEIN